MNVVMTKTTIVVIEVEKNGKKIVATQKQMLRHNNELKADISIATIKAAESKISVATKNGREVS